jgi:hypothetical protein
VSSALTCTEYWGLGDATSNGIATGFTSGTAQGAYVKTGTTAVITINQFDDSGWRFTSFTSGAPASISCIYGSAVSSTTLGYVCSSCNDPDFGVPNGLTCTYTNGVIATLTACQPGYGVVAASGSTAAYCLTCGANVKTCSFSGTTATPLTCNSGYYLSSTPACVILPTNAVGASTAGVPSSCSPGYFVSGSTCAACGSGAATCTSNTAATTCLNTYYLNSATTCASLPVGLTNC